MNSKRMESTKNFLAILAVAIVIAAVAHVVSVISYNSKVHRTQGEDDRKQAVMVLNDREDSTSSWLKRDFDMDGRTVDLTGQTFDGVLTNKSSSEISEWMMRINIKGDCYLNNAWCGVVEVHQHVGSDNEKVQTLDLRKYELEDVKLDHVYDGDLLIPLSKGDYIMYYPSAKEREMPVAGKTELTIGMILYYLDGIDLSDHYISYKLHKSFFEGKGFYAVLGLALVWIAGFFAYVVATLSYRRAWKDMELRKTGVAYMSDIYDMIYMADLVNDDITTIKGADAARGNARGSVVSRLGKLFIDDVTDEYRQVAEEFMDPATLEERFDRESIACQYMSKTKGWCLVRLFAIDRREGEPLRRFIFTIQNINDEKTEMDEIEDSITGSENETAGIVPESVPYSIRDIVDEALADVSEEAELRGTEVTSDIAADLPEKLTGDPGKLRMVIACMLLSALRHAGGKSIRLSLFAKETKDGKEHLLVSVRDSGDGKKDDEKDFGGLGLKAAEEMLRIMDSELRSIYEEGAGSELYFEIEQEKA